MPSFRKVAALASLSALPLSLAQSYTLKTNYAGSDFASHWNFSTAVDRNFGFVAYQSQAVAASQKLVYTTSSNTVIVKVDNTTVGNPADTTYGRASVYLESLETLGLGSLVLFDAVHVPYGCSVWPGFFTQGPGEWPLGGEIDIFENVNQATLNQYALHTYPAGCTLGSGTESGKIISTDCFNNTNSNQGCIVQETKPNSYGTDFNANGGGGYAMQMDSTGIKIWWFPRASLPSDWTSNSPNPSAWSSPSAFYPSSSCDVSKFFGPQQIILEIDICGSYAGDGGAFAQTCSGSCVDLLKTPTNYDQAYFELNFIKTFTTGSSNGTTTTGTNTGKSTATSSLGATAPTGSTTKSGALASFSASWVGLGATALGMVGAGLAAVLV
ncbi:hypothetical protein DL93DRAFT_2167313 [Clavulina sp. PMI_390]|nr:hypothetical protein DL93DRAFT_2167313 [Clavulina sp. PMI_390]